MAFFVVVHHRRDQSQPWKNSWRDDDRLEAISTTPDIAGRCALAKRNQEKVFVHRCGWMGSPPTVCCAAAAQEAGSDSSVGWVQFRDHSVLRAKPPLLPGRGQNSYEADSIV